VRHRECLWHDGRAAGFNSELGAVMLRGKASSWVVLGLVVDAGGGVADEDC